MTFEKVSAWIRYAKSWVSPKGHLKTMSLTWRVTFIGHGIQVEDFWSSHPDNTGGPCDYFVLTKLLVKWAGLFHLVNACTIVYKLKKLEKVILLMNEKSQNNNSPAILFTNKNEKHFKKFPILMMIFSKHFFSFWILRILSFFFFFCSEIWFHFLNWKAFVLKNFLCIFFWDLLFKDFLEILFLFFWKIKFPRKDKTKAIILAWWKDDDQY